MDITFGDNKEFFLINNADFQVLLGSMLIVKREDGKLQRLDLSTANLTVYMPDEEISKLQTQVAEAQLALDTEVALKESVAKVVPIEPVKEPPVEEPPVDTPPVDEPPVPEP